MKKLLFFLFACFLLLACKDKPKVPVTSSTAQISFDSTLYQFGNVKLGDTHQHTFVFHNTGNTPLVIQDVRVGCSCTTVDYDKAPVSPGREGKITVTYDDEGCAGFFDKSATVISNSSTGQVILRINGTVVR